MGAENLDPAWLLSTLFGRTDSAQSLTADSYDERTRVHEAGHALIPLTLGGSFEHVVVYAGGRGGQVRRPRYYSLEDCIAGHVAGAVAEELKFGSICAPACASDMTTALRRAFRLDRTIYIDPSVEIVKEQIALAREMIDSNMDLLERIVAALKEEHVLTFAECEEIIA